MAFRASTNATSAGTSSLSCNKPVGTIDGDVLAAGVLCGSPNVVTPPAGWGLRYSSGTFGPTKQMLVYTKLASSEGASWAWGFGTSNGAVIEVVALSGREATAVPNAEGGQTNASSANVVAPSISPPADNCDLVGFFGTDASTTFTAPGTMTEREDAVGAARTMELATEVLGAAGATGTRTAVAGSAAANAGWIGAFAPAVNSASLLMAFP